MIPDPRWCDADPVRCAESVAGTRDAYQAVGFALLAGVALFMLVGTATALARDGRYRLAAGVMLAAATLAAVSLAGFR